VATLSVFYNTRVMVLAVNKVFQQQQYMDEIQWQTTEVNVSSILYAKITLRLLTYLTDKMLTKFNLGYLDSDIPTLNTNCFVLILI